jgi:hypothetical protein
MPEEASGIAGRDLIKYSLHVGPQCIDASMAC